MFDFSNFNYIPKWLKQNKLVQNIELYHLKKLDVLKTINNENKEK